MKLPCMAMCLVAAFASLAQALPARRIQLTDGPLFVPPGFTLGTNGLFDLTLHLHGAPAVVEKSFLAAQYPGVLANVTLPGLSAAYTAHFKNTNTFWRIVSEAEAALKTDRVPAPRVGRLTVTSFSAGFGGVRELLADHHIFARIRVIVMADSIYAGFIGDNAGRKVNPEHMRGFLQFAREAAEGGKRLLISHTQLHTPTYASTAETADYLVAQLGGHRDFADADWPGGLKQVSRFRRGQCEIIGFEGMTGEQHMEHLRQLHVFLEAVR